MSQWNSALRDFEEFHCSGIPHNTVLRNSALVEFRVMRNRVTRGLGVIESQIFSPPFTGQEVKGCENHVVLSRDIRHLTTMAIV